jgi:hypothetical protein
LAIALPSADFPQPHGTRAGVRPDVAERVLGHVIAGVEAVYDRHSYFDEKADALAKLAALIVLLIHHYSS